MNNRLGSLLVKFILSTLIIAAGIGVVLNRQAVIDWARLVTYRPSSEVEQLAVRSKFTPRGRDLFYVSDPKIQDSSEFNASCNSSEQTIVLGCYKAQRIFLYNVRDERFNGVKEVTAAHEMLHAAYERLGDADKQMINELLRPIIEGMEDQRILELIELYNKTEPGELYNEMHAILGTEYRALTPDLEAYYKKYFDDRAVLVGYAGQYQAVFTASREKIDAFDRQLTALKPQIDQNNETLKRLQAELQTENNQLNQDRAQGRVQQYNQAVPGYNAKVAQFNALIEQTRGLVATYNAIVEERNAQVAAQTNLYESINSNYQPASQN